FFPFLLGLGPSVRLTLLEGGKVAPAPGEEDLTTSGPSFLPSCFLGLVTLPREQWAALSAERAWPCISPTSSGTTHFSSVGGGGGLALKVAVGVVSASIVILQVPVPEQPAPLPPAKVELEAA